MSTASDQPRSTYAGIVSRLLALVVDVAVIVLLVLAVDKLPVIAWESISPHTAPSWLAGVCSFAAALVPWLYFTAFWSLSGQTPGDLLAGIVVEHSDGHRLGLFHAALRAAVGLTLAPLWLVGLLAILWTDRRRAWHDQLMRTDVRYATRGHKPWASGGNSAST